jgi:hypothetical protein
MEDQHSFSKSYPNVHLYFTKVQGVLPEQNMVYLKDEQGTDVTALVVVNMFTQMMGLSSMAFPEKGTEVIVLSCPDKNNHQSNYVIGCVPSATQKIGRGLAFTNYVGSDKDYYKGIALEKRKANEKNELPRVTGTYPSNLVDGESAYVTKTGAGVEFLYNLCRLKGSELAMIEAYILDDLVRILSRNFEHLTSFGDFKIINSGGGLNVLWQGTSNEYEALGSDAEGEPIDGFEIGEKDNLNVDPDDESNFLWDAKWRFTKYIGKIGNFIHTYITDPGKNLVSENEANQFKAGRYNFHVNQDGSVVMQSISDIVFEKTVRIPVPVANDRLEAIQAATNEQLNAYEVWTPLEGEELYETSYKLADYTKWLSNYYALAGFYAANVFNIPSEEESPEPDPYCKDRNFQAQNGGGNYHTQFTKMLQAYATIRIFKDGSIVLYDAYGSAVHMTAGHVNISAARSINLTAAENVNITAGRDVIVNAGNNIELSAMFKGILLKARTWLEMLCSKGAVVIESAMTKNQEQQAQDSDDEEYLKRLKNANGNGIILTTSHGGSSKEDGAGISLRTNGTLFEDAYYYANRCKYVLFDLMAGIGQFVIGNALSVINSTLKLNAFKTMANVFYAKSIYTQQRKPAIVMGSEQETLVNYDQNDANYPSGTGFETTGESDAADINQMNEYVYFNPTNGWFSTYNAQFEYRDTMYYNTQIDDKNDKLFEPLTYQKINNDSSNNYQSFNMSDLTDDISVATRKTPYPGNNVNVNTYSPSNTDLNEPCADKGESLLTNNNEIEKTSYSLKQYNPENFI